MTTLCGFGIKVSLHFVRFVKSVATRQRIVSLMESVGGVAPLTTRRVCPAVGSVWTVVSAVSDSSAVLEGAAALTTPIPPYFPQI